MTRNIGNTRLNPRALATLATLVLLAASTDSIDAGDDTVAKKVAEKSPAATLVVLPGEFTLSGSASFQQLVPGLMADGHFTGTPTGPLEWSSSNPRVVSVKNQTVRPTGNGQATITVRHGQLVATAQVTVTDFDRPVTWDFRIHVQSVLTKAGCNSGACHGALAGKNGFKLSECTDQLVIATNGDVITDQSIAPLLDLHQSSGALVTILLTQLISPYGIVGVDDAGQVSSFVEKPSLPHWINAGVYVLDSSVFSRFPAEGDHETLTFPDLAQQGRIAGFKSTAFWSSVESPKDLREASERLQALGRA